MLASLFVSIGNHTNTELDENAVRHVFLNSIRQNRKQFFNEFGEIVICADSRNSWRKGFFPYYKSNRKQTREESELDWNELFRIMTLIRTELDEFFPYKVIEIDSCEADDIIGTICHKYGLELNNGSEPILILSGDKDYIQLHKYANVRQYSPTQKKWIQNSDPAKFLTEHILKGDSGDGIPNILSPDNSLAAKIRQKPMTKERITTFSDGPSVMDEVTKSRYERNKKMIDLSEVPENLKQAILEAYEQPKTIGRSKLMNFFIDKRLKYLMPDITEF